MSRHVDQDILQIAQQLMDMVVALGESEADIYTFRDEGLSLSYSDKKVDQLGFFGQNQLTLKLFQNNKTAVVTTTDLTQASLNLCLEKAQIIAGTVDKDPCHGLPPPELCQQSDDMFDLQLDHPKEMNIEDMVELCAAMDSKGHEIAGITRTDSIDVYASEAQVVHLNSQGFAHQLRSTNYSVSACFIAGKDNKMVRDYDYSVARCWSDLQDPLEIATRAASKAASHIGARTLSERKCPIILSAHLARRLMGMITAAISGTAIYKQTSFLLDQLDQMVFSPSFSLVERPHMVKQMGSRWFDDEGVATRDRVIVDSGRLMGYCLDEYSARKLGLQSTGHAGGVHNLQVESGDMMSEEELIRQCDTGLYVTDWMGQGVNLQTGDFSKGVVGFWIENGRIAYPVHEATIASTLAEMMKNCLAMGDQIDRRGAIHSGAILIDEMTIAG